MQLAAIICRIGVGFEHQEKGCDYYIADLSIIYNMFSFKQKQQPKQSKPQLDKNLQRLKLFASATSVKSNLNCYYAQLWESLNGKQGNFRPRYQKQISRIKKSEAIWNYSDISIVRNCIKKSMFNESLSVLVEKWCECMEIYLLEPMLEPLGNTTPRVNLKEDRIRIIQTQILLFCQFVFSFGFEMYFIFFYKHYQQRSKLGKDVSFTKAQIYQKQHLVFEDFVRNSLTGLPLFQALYHQYLAIILNGSIYGRQIHKMGQQFNEFLLTQLKIRQSYQKIYQETARSIWDFHSESALQQKILKSTYIIPSIQKDHKNYYERQKMDPIYKQETITTKILDFLFKLYCPQAIVSIRYIQMLICYRLSEEKYEDLVEQFCFVWIGEDIHSKFHVIADSFENK